MDVFDTLLLPKLYRRDGLYGNDNTQYNRAILRDVTDGAKCWTADKRRDIGSASEGRYFVVTVSSHAGVASGSFGSCSEVVFSDSCSLERRLSLTGLVEFVGEMDMLCWMAGGDACGMLCVTHETTSSQTFRSAWHDGSTIVRSGALCLSWKRTWITHIR